MMTLALSLDPVRRRLGDASDWGQLPIRHKRPPALQLRRSRKLWRAWSSASGECLALQHCLEGDSRGHCLFGDHGATETRGKGPFSSQTRQKNEGARTRKPRFGGDRHRQGSRLLCPHQPVLCLPKRQDAGFGRRPAEQAAVRRFQPPMVTLLPDQPASPHDAVGRRPLEGQADCPSSPGSRLAAGFSFEQQGRSPLHCASASGRLDFIAHRPFAVCCEAAYC
jgi:hypothetical protein